MIKTPEPSKATHGSNNFIFLQFSPFLYRVPNLYTAYDYEIYI